MPLLLVLALWSAACADPKPTLVILGTSATDAPTYDGLAEALPDWQVTALDLPAHGDDVRPGDTTPLTAWRDRLTAGEPVIETFTARLSAHLDTLDTNWIVLVGTSRGGFLALHAMAADPRVEAVIAFMPVTELRALTEFTDAPDVDRYDVARLPLRGRRIWLTIRADDPRVSTAATRRAAAALDATLVVTPGSGHVVDHATEADAARWLLAH